MVPSSLVRVALAFLFHWLLLLQSFHVRAAIVNRTIDDTFGDSETLAKPFYVGSTSGIWKDHTCTDCGINPDTRQAFKNSYTAVTYSPLTGRVSLTLTFNGTAIYVFFILVNNAGDGITSVTDCKFAMDNDEPVAFRHAPDLTTTAIMYNQLVYRRTDLPFRTHRLEIFSDADFNSYINFDYAIYTHDDDPISSTIIPTSTPTTIVNSTFSTSTTSFTTPRGESNNNPNTNTRFNSNGDSSAPGSTASPTDSPQDSGETSQGSSGPSIAAIAGGVAGGIIFIIFLFLCLFLLRRHRRKQAAMAIEEGESHQGMYYNHGRSPYLPADSHHRELSENTSSMITQLSAPVTTQGPDRRSYHPSTLSSASMYSDDAYSGIARNYAYSDAVTTVSRSASRSTAGTLASSNIDTYRNGSRRDRSRRKQLQIVNESNEPNPDLPPSLPPPIPPRHPARPPNTILAATSFAQPSGNQRLKGQERAREARQAEIDERLRAIERDIDVLGQDMQGRQITVPLRPVRRQGGSTGSSGGSDTTRESDAIAAMGEQMRLMQQEIERLRENQRSEWAQGLTDEPPPGYYSPRRPSALSMGGT